METTCRISEDLSQDAQRRIERHLFKAFVEAGRAHGKSKIIVTDGDGKTFTYADILRAAFALSAPLKKAARPNEAVGVLLPTGVGAVVTLFSLHAAGCIPAMLNFSCLLYTSPSPRDQRGSRMPSSA